MQDPRPKGKQQHLVLGTRLVGSGRQPAKKKTTELLCSLGRRAYRVSGIDRVVGTQGLWLFWSWVLGLRVWGLGSRKLRIESSSPRLIKLPLSLLTGSWDLVRN